MGLPARRCPLRSIRRRRRDRRASVRTWIMGLAISILSASSRCGRADDGRQVEQQHQQHQGQHHAVLHVADLVDRLVFGGQVVDVPGQGRRGLADSVSHSFSGWPTLTAAVKMMGAVSPAARPMLMMMPVRMPGRAAGRITVSTVCQLARAQAQRCLLVGHAARP